MCITKLMNRVIIYFEPIIHSYVTLISSTFYRDISNLRHRLLPNRKTGEEPGYEVRHVSS